MGSHRYSLKSIINKFNVRNNFNNNLSILMSGLNKQKLSQIKQKYGYTSKASVVPNFELPNDTFESQNLHSRERISKEKRQPHYTKTYAILQDRTQYYNFQEPKDNKIIIQTSLVKKVERTSDIKERKPPINNEKQNIVQSYEKTYDLLNNYRKRVKNCHEKQQQMKTEICKGQTSNKTQAKDQPAMKGMNFRDEQKRLFTSRGLSISRVNNAIARPIRCSPLSSVAVDQGHAVKHQIQKIQKIQDKIHQLLQERTS